MLWFEGVFDTDIDSSQLQRLRCLRVDSLHTYIGQLISHHEVGVTHDDGILLAHQLRIGRRQVELFMDNSLIRLHLDSDL